MSEETEMFEAIEMHVERMFLQVSDNERRNNPALSIQEDRLRLYLERLREILSEKDFNAIQTEEHDVSH